MADYCADIIWQRGADEDFIGDKYSRAHEWHFDGGAIVPASASPQIVALPQSVAEHVDPEEAFVAALSSCHMLFFLSLAAKKRLVVDRYNDTAVGTLAEGRDGRWCMTVVSLCPTVVVSGAPVSFEKIEALHHKAHELCFIANSVTSEIRLDLSVQKALLS